MKKSYLLFIFCFITYLANAQASFITTWQVEEENLTIIVPIQSSVNNNYSIDFGDGTVLNNLFVSDQLHTYSSPGTYTVIISGNFSSIDFESLGNAAWSEKIYSIEQWGDVQWSTMHHAFFNCQNLVINATDVPDLSQVTDMSYMFFGCDSFNHPIDNWDVSNVTNMESLFKGCVSFNQPLNNWDVSNATNMKNMFESAIIFNQPLNNWDVSNVTSMESMFYNAISFNQLLNDWDISNVTSIAGMFREASDFNQPLNNWDISSIVSMTGIFGGATSFNQPIDNWDVSNVTNMLAVFEGASSFNQPLNEWDVSNVTSMDGIFKDAVSFNKPLNNWVLSSCTNMYWMFNGATSFNQAIDNWDVSNVIYMDAMFKDATSFDQALNSWDVSSVISMSDMFNGASTFNQPLNNWDISGMNYMWNMFYNASNFNQDISDWNFPSYVILSNAGNYNFIANSGLDTDNYDALLAQFVELELENRTIYTDGLYYCDYENRLFLVEDLGWTISGDFLGEDCLTNKILGTAFLDENADGCDINDIILTNFMVNATDGTYSFATLVNDEGEYDLTVFENNYNVTLLNIPDYFVVTPATSTANFTGFGNEEELNFCLTAIQTIEDTNVTLLPIDEARPGFESEYQLVIENMSTQTVANLVVTLTFDETLQTFVTAIPTATSITANQLTFSIENLQPFASSIINFTMQTFTPPTVNGGEIAEFTAIVTPDANDNTPNDNTFILEQEIVNSFDPNDKRVVQGGEIFIEEASEYLDYIIRFQNTGTASAITVRIEDTLSENLDWTTFKPISASHDYTVQITDGNQVEFIFNNINLPHEAADESGSNGYIAYKIKPVAGLVIGDIINGNTAGIYFDYNLPIVTNATSTEIVEVLKIDNFVLNNQITIYPNPTSDIINIQAENGIELQEVMIYNLQGSELMSFKQHLAAIDVSELSTGIYFLLIKTDSGLVKHRLVKN